MREFIEENFGISDEMLLRTLLEQGKVETVKRGKQLVACGENQAVLPVLISGIFRGYVLDEEGREVTDCFSATPGDFVISCGGLMEPSRVSFEAMSDCEVLMLPIEPLLATLAQSRELMNLYNRVLLEALQRHWELKILLLQCSAMGRYQWFLKKYPGLIDEVSNKHIASFLGMTPVTLSRLRQKLKELTGSASGVLQ